MAVRRALRFLTVAVLAVGAAAGSAVHAAPGDELVVPSGYRVAERQDLLAGVSRYRLVAEAPVPVVVHVARIAPGAPVSLRAVLSNDRVGAPAPALERTSAMCRRVGCLLGVNADFFSPDGTPIGAMVSGGELVRSPVPTHHQVAITDQGRLTAGNLDWNGRLVASDLSELRLTAMNTPRPAGGVVLYSPAFGPTTATNGHGVEMVLRLVPPMRAVRVAETVLVEVGEVRDGVGNAPIPADGLVLSGNARGADAIRALAARIESGAAGPRLLLRADLAAGPGGAPAPGVVRESVGGTPVLLRDGHRWVPNRGDGFITGRHPRTAVAWSPGGATLLVTVDGRQPGYSEGLSLPHLADLLAGMGATDALNLDGGGSTTFVERGVVINQPSDRLVARGGANAIALTAIPGASVLGIVERPVVSALLIVPSVAVPFTSTDPLTLDPRLPQALAAPAEARGDPASDPSGGSPALVAALPPPAPVVPLTIALVLLCSVAVGTARSLKVASAR